jgi:hypothetical protein
MNRVHDSALARAHRELAAAAGAVVRGDRDLVIGVRVVMELGYELDCDLEDPDLRVLAAFESVTHDLPAATADRAELDPLLRERVDRERAELESRWRADVQLACRRLIERLEG